MKYHGQKVNWEEKGLFGLTSISLSITEGTPGRNLNRAGTWRQELIQRPVRGAAYWFAPLGLLSLLSYRTQEQQARDQPLPHRSLIKKTTYS